MHCDSRTASLNLSAVAALVSRIEKSSGKQRTRTGLIWRDVPGRDVADQFFERYKSPAAARRVQGATIAEYVRIGWPPRNSPSGR